MVNEIIDLTTSPPEKSCVRDAQQPVSTSRVHTRIDGETKTSRRKRRKRALEDEGGKTSAINAREHSLEEGELERHITPERERHLSDEDGSVKRKRPSSHQTPADTVNFFIDVEPTPIPIAHSLVPPSAPESDGGGGKLLLPVHVSVFGLTPVEILPTANLDLDGEDYIEYLDYEERKDLVRYFEDTTDGSAKKPNRVVCKNCGAEGEHKTAACPVLICLTCGARDEHPTRSCPISKTCFRCGMKGHINATCPNQNSARIPESIKYGDCSRCGSRLHTSNECPTLWRLYEYLTDEGQSRTFRTRNDRRNQGLGEGGEGYIATDEWCYNCGCCGHWGDDCHDIPHRGDFPQEPSAFSTHNTLSGPFSDVELPRSTSHHRRPREWEHSDLPNTWGSDLPENVGKQGRRKNAEKLERRVKEQEAEEDQEDWFGNPRNSRSRLMDDRSSGLSKKITFGKSIQQAGRQFRPPSLADRLGEPIEHSHSRRPPKPRSSNYEYNRDHKYQPKRDDGFRQGHRRREEAGPRYKGGYGR